MASAIQIPSLPPDIRFERMRATDEDFEFSFAVKHAALGPYIVERWGWDEEFQRGVHRTRFDEKPFFRIAMEERSIGMVSLMSSASCIRFGEFYLFPDLHGRGLGTRVLRHCLRLADEIGLPVRLEYLKWNRVGSLYKRHGFQVTGETDIHILMERQPGASWDAR